MRVFADTSALYALFNRDDLHHGSAEKAFEMLRRTEVELATTNYVLLECARLLQRRKGFPSAKSFLTEATNRASILWVDEAVHAGALGIWSKEQARQARGLSLVDCVSFAAMRRGGIRRALAFDAHFAQQGFEVIP